MKRIEDNVSTSRSFQKPGQKKCYDPFMKIVRTLKVTPDEFFDNLEQDVIDSVEKATGYQVTSKDIKSGLKFTIDKQDKFRKIDTTILNYKRGEVFKSKRKSTNDCVIVEYRVKPVEKGIEVTFNQSVENYLKKDRSVGKFSESVYLGRMAESLLNMEEKIIFIRKGDLEYHQRLQQGLQLPGSGLYKAWKKRREAKAKEKEQKTEA